MQGTTNDEKQQQPVAQPSPQSQPLPPAAPAPEEDEDDPEVIFAKAVAEIETQPLIRKSRNYPVAYILQDALCLTVVLIGLAGIIWQVITYPHMLVILFTKAQPASITVPLDIATRTLAPIIITRSATTATTGTGYQKARAATGYVIFYNGLSTGQTIPAGTVLTGRDGEHIVTTQEAVIPAADTTTTPPTDGFVTVSAQAVQSGRQGNIAAYDVSVVFSPSLTVKNLSAFTHGQDERTYKAVAPQDLQTLTTTANDTMTQAFTTAFSVQSGEAAFPTNCHTTTSSNHQVGEEATNLTVTSVRTCSAIAYNQSHLTHAATIAFTKTRPAASYHMVGRLQTTFQSMTPLTVTLSGKWAYTFTPDYEQFLAQQIQEEKPAQARASLVRTGVIFDASIPAQLPPAMYINFFVLVD